MPQLETGPFATETAKNIIRAGQLLGGEVGQPRYNIDTVLYVRTAKGDDV
jgi:hypothetical protein